MRLCDWATRYFSKPLCNLGFEGLERFEGLESTPIRLPQVPLGPRKETFLGMLCPARNEPGPEAHSLAPLGD